MFSYMRQNRLVLSFSWLFSLFSCLLIAIEASAAPGVWTGLSVEFVRPDDVDPEDPINQDMITSNVVLTRGSREGIFNIAKESAYVQHTSPTDTLWATSLNNPGADISASNWEALTFDHWRTAYDGAIFFNFDRPAVMQLITDNVYLDIHFTGWTSSFGGGFSYMRADGVVPPPMVTTTGDYNGNGFVDAADYTIWRNTFGQTATPMGSGADGIADGTIDELDYAFWKTRFGDLVETSGSASVASVSVPEPALVTSLSGVAMLLVAARRRLSRPTR